MRRLLRKEENMPHQIKAINAGGIDCFLIKTGAGFVLIDTGVANKPANLEKELQRAGCKPGNLNLIVLTHGDFDHSGNAAYIRDRFGAKIAMHIGDSGMVERGDQSWNRKAKPDRVTILGRIIAFISPFFTGPIEFDTFKPDLYVEDGYDLSEYGLDARVLHLPGHSKGSIGIWTTDGDLFCGDLLANFSRPSLHFVIDDLVEANVSLEKLKKLNIKTIYPGHGKPFPMELFTKSRID